MSRRALVFLLVAQILVLEAMAHQSEVSGKSPVELKTETAVQSLEKTDKTADQPVSGATESSVGEGEGESKAAEAPEIRRLGKRHSTDKSVAGGGVIIGGLLTAIFAAVFCYIRVTRRRDAAHSPCIA